MNIYFDTEFTGLYKDTDLISIGLISDDGKEFYAEFTDFRTDRIDDWIEENILSNTVRYGKLSEIDVVLDETNYYEGTKEEIKEQLWKWLSQFDEVQLISDVCHYDMVLLIDIFGTAFDLPTNVTPSCHDINQDIAIFEHTTECEAFNRSREEFLSDYNIEISGAKHNALYDAKVIKEIYNIVSRS